MQCTKCSSEIPLESRFCLHCGNPVGSSAAPLHPSVDGVALIKHYIPPELAERILKEGKKIESERRLVTVLFADVTGFTALAEQNDVEVVSAVLNDCFSGLVSIVLKYEGTIDKFIGDGIMAIFGAPLAHENDPERAARCALEMMAEIDRFNTKIMQRLPAPLGLHVGLHSGMVIAGNVGSDLRMNYSVIGDTVNLAARLVELAPRDEIYMTDETYRLVSNTMNVEGPFKTAFKGKAAPVDVFRLRGLKEESSEKRLRADDELIGRKKELDLVRLAITRVLAKDHARLFIRGEAGVGKSRLKAELVRMAYQSGVAAYEGACSSFETNTPYYLWTSLLKDILKIEPGSEESVTRQRLSQITRALGLAPHEPYLGALLSLRYDEIVHLDETLRKRRIFQAARALLSALSLQRPLVFVLEDLHWIDRFSQELLEYMFSRTTAVVLSLFALTFRDEYTRFAQFGDEGTLIDLNRLNRGDACALIRHQLDVEGVPPVVEEFILRRSEGNPFFIHELIKTLLDKKIIAVRRRKVDLLTENIEAGIPGTIQGIIMARIDRLQDSIKEVLFGASVIGREFSRPILEHVIEQKGDIAPTLHELRSLELILEKTEAREFEYLFKHFLIQEVAYNTMLLNKRKELHASIAEAIEQLYPDKLVEFYELLAFHYEKAEQWDKAAEYLSRAGHKTSQMYSREEGSGFFERKKAAITKLYQAASAKPSLGAMLKAITPPLIAMLVPIVPIFVYVRLLGRSQSSDWTLQLAVGVVISLLCIWYALSLWYLGVVPFLRGRPKMYDLMGDHVRVIYGDGTTLSIDFDEIESIHLYNTPMQQGRPLRYKIIDPLGRVENYSALTFGRWFREVVLNILPPYAFGIGSGKGEIHVRLKCGYQVMRVFVPWLNTPLKSRTLSLLPFDPREFYNQFEIALTKWTRRK